MPSEQKASGKQRGLDPALQRGLTDLQDEMAMLDLLRRPASRSGAMELLLKKHRLLKLTMDGNRNHARAHLHIDYHRTPHMASYAIDNGELLAGDPTYSQIVQPWIAKHRADLTRVWEDIRGTGADPVTVAQLLGSQL